MGRDSSAIFSPFICQNGCYLHPVFLLEAQNIMQEQRRGNRQLARVQLPKRIQILGVCNRVHTDCADILQSTCKECVLTEPCLREPCFLHAFPWIAGIDFLRWNGSA